MKGDLLVDTANPAALDQTLQMIGAVLIGGPNFIQHDGHYVVRCFADPGFIKFAIINQGYAKLVRDAPDPAPWDVTPTSLGVEHETDGPTES